MPDIKVRVGQQNTVKVLASAYGGSLTAETATNVIGGIASVSQLLVSNSGVSTLTGPVGLASDLNVAGVSTFVGVSTFGGDVYIGGDLHLKDDIVLDEISARSLTVSGVSTLGVTSTTLLESQQLNVTGVSTFNGVTKFNLADVVFQGNAAGQNITYDASENDLEFTDAARIKFGNSDDLEIWHDAPNSHIKNSTGDFKIRSDSLALKTADDSEKYLKAVKNADVKLYYNGNEKFATISTGATVTGDLYIGGDLYLGDDLVLDNITGNSLKITGLSTFVGDAQFDGNVSIGGTLTYEDVTNVDSIGIVTARQGFRATAGGIDITAGISTFRQGINVAGLSYLDGDVSFVGAAYNLLWDKDTSKLKFYDLAQATFGDGNDLQIYSDGTNGIIKGNDSTNILGITSVTSVDYYGTDATLTGTLTAGLIDGGSY